ncbi:MAG TPA: TolC family protein, partial [Schlesneria sp.]
MRRTAAVLGICAMTMMVVGGCLRHANTPPPAVVGVDAAHYQNLAKKIEIPDHPTPSEDLLATTPAPRSLMNLDSEEYLDLSLEETIHLALANSSILRDLGGTMLRTPDAAKSRFDSSVVETDPRVGVESALSAFDAAFTTN